MLRLSQEGPTETGISNKQANGGWDERNAKQTDA